jgi:hypothetical protein
MKLSTMRRLMFVGVLAMFAFAANAATIVTSGTLADGTPYRIDYPDNWNGTLLVALDYAPNGGNSATNRELQARGYATSGISRGVTGWSVGDAIDNHVSVVDIFTTLYGPPAFSFVNGGSLGAHTGASVIQARPDVFDGGMLQCGSLAGVIGLWNGKMDALFVLKTLLAPGDPRYPVIDIPDDFAAVTRPDWLALVDAAQATPEGRARIALAGVIAQLPTWSSGAKPIPAPGDYDALQEGLYDSLAGAFPPVIGQAMSSRNEINRRSGGNISWNLGVDYAAILAEVDNSDVVQAMYDQAGLSLADDLAMLADAERIVADPDAIRWARVQVPVRPLTVPVVTMNGIGDMISPVAGQQAYEAVVGSENLRQTYTQTAGHCGFNGPELIAAIEVLQLRAETGIWPATDPVAMNSRAESVDLNGTPRFIDFEPDEFARPFTFIDVPADVKVAVIVAHSNGKVHIDLTPMTDNPDFAADKIVAESIRLAGVAPVSSKLKGDTLRVSFRAGDIGNGTNPTTGTIVSIPLSGAFIYGVPIDEQVSVSIKP